MSETLYKMNTKRYNMLHLIFHTTDYPIVTLSSIFMALLYFKHGVLVH